MLSGRISKLGLRLYEQAWRLSSDARGIAAVEFAMLVPLMLMIFFGTIQISTVVAVDRKVSLTARTLSDLISQIAAAQSTDFYNAFQITTAILYPYPPYPNQMPSAPVNAIISQVRINPTTLAGEITWSVASNATAHNYKDVVPVPSTLQVAGAYLILSEVTYAYQPMVGFDIKSKFISSAFTLSDSMFTRPRQGVCVTYSTWTSCPTTGNLP